MNSTLEQLAEIARTHPRASREVLMVPLTAIEPDPEQPRKDPGDLEELAASIEAIGVQQPLLVRPKAGQDGAFILVAGERRLLAASRTGKAKVPCLLLADLDDPGQRLIVQLTENIQREDLHMMEVARAIQTLIDELQMSKGELARLLGKSQSFVSKHLALLKANGPSKDALERGLLQSPETFRLFRKLPEQRQRKLLGRERAIAIGRAEVEKAAANPGGSRAPAPAQTELQFSLRLTREQLVRIIEALGGQAALGSGRLQGHAHQSPLGLHRARVQRALPSHSATPAAAGTAVAGRWGVSDLEQILHDYLSLRRALGFKLERPGALLPRFVASVKASGSSIITTALALAWARKPERVTERSAAKRLAMVRVFARYAHSVDPRHEIPPPELLPERRRRLPPYIYSDAEVVALMAATHRIGDPFRAHTYRTIIGLLASTGMRVGEALALDQAALQAEGRLITVRHGKFGKSREVPLHETTFGALEGYARRRHQRFRQSAGRAFFVSLAGTRLIYNNVHRTFFQLVAETGLADRAPRRPRIHDLRHTFAVRTLVDWYRAGLDVESQLPVLSTYLGHVNPSTTYWYLSAVPELLAIAAQRLEDSLGELP